MSVIRDKSVVHELFTEIGPQYAGRPGGHADHQDRPRKGDNAPMAVIELVEPMAEAVVKEATSAAKRAARDAQKPAATEPETTDEVEATDPVEAPEAQAESAERLPRHRKRLSQGRCLTFRHTRTSPRRKVAGSCVSGWIWPTTAGSSQVGASARPAHGLRRAGHRCATGPAGGRHPDRGRRAY